MKRFTLFLWVCCVLATGCSTSRVVANRHRGAFDTNSDAASASEFRWPVRYVQVTSTFGQRGKEFHEGLDLRASPGTPVYASKAGVVLYSDSKIRGYGKLVVIRHIGSVATIYAHNSQLLVRRGQRVNQGQLIAKSGSTGHVQGPHVHFEIRRGMAAVNPLRLLPQFVRPPSLRSDNLVHRRRS